MACIAAVGLLVCRSCGQAADARLLHDAALKGLGGTSAGGAPSALTDAAVAIAALRDEALRNAAAGQAILETLDGQDAQPPQNASLSANSTDSAVPYLLLDTKGMVTCASPTLLALLDADPTPPVLPATLEAVGLRPAPADSTAAELLRNLREGRAATGELAIPRPAGYRTTARPPAHPAWSTSRCPPGPSPTRRAAPTAASYCCAT
ncbi:hypothetical protein [Nitratidesulfovibrio liaohensis]|uniref:PAS fold-4 domain-containing protein n=1 Tax=Nitratidesulfovibrio liaohensis TaxID=2604158 RepID=A0ABY9R1A5_9BACT|nr:hypothetical protein [Nitratidesulfovibrio liaohensis]WMW65387.1 hypothetical protein KPS_003513 [Nitratidesulfovibrio liaohensis]